MEFEMEAIIDTVFVGRPKTLHDERGSWRSSIARSPIEGPVLAAEAGLQGDQPTQPYHGGRDGAICVHLREHYEFWNRRYGMQLVSGSMGENLTLGGILEEQICAGDIVRLGSVLAQVSCPRVPCANLARRIGRPDWVKLTIRENRTGFYLRVLEGGSLQAGDRWQLEERPNAEASILALNRCLYLEFDPALAGRFAELPELAAWWRQQFLERLAEQGAHWSATMGR
jgi:MOSC domain-containing protein YiiM